MMVFLAQHFGWVWSASGAAALVLCAAIGVIAQLREDTRP